MFPQPLQQRIETCGIVAVVVIDRSEDALPLARALLSGGVRAMELTLRTPAALPALWEITSHLPEMLVGAGTVLTRQQVIEAQNAGAAFAVAPGANPTVLRAARDVGLPFAPGVMTPSDIEIAIEHDCRLLKYFPAEAVGGLATLKAIAAPYAHLGIRYLPLGGLTTSLIASYLGSPLVAALGGSWLASRESIGAQDWEAISRRAKEATDLIQSLRKQ